MKAISIACEEPPIAADAQPAPLVVLLDRAEAQDVARSGGKAANLARMLQAGLPVPRGFCVTAQAFRQQIAAQSETELLWTAMARFQAGPVDELLAAGRRLREQLAAVPLVPAIERAVLEAWQEQGAARAYAVRSSATVEDGCDASFAGQGETRLNVRGRQAILDAVRACWVSLFADRAILYRKGQAIDHRTAAMAVVVQDMVCADVSGVLFTADPRSGDRRRMVVEAVYGLGQSLVSGEVSPDRIVLAKPSLRTLDYRLGTKAVEVVPKRGTGPRRRPVDPERQTSACLDKTALRHLGTLALQAERSLGGPQDIEWAMTRAGIFLLQARPITTAKQKTEEPLAVWSNMNSWEVLPGVVAPMSWSLLSSHVKCMFRPVLAALGIDVDRQPLFGLIAGRAYANLGTFVAIAHAMPLAGRLDFIEGLGGQHSKRLAEQLVQQAAKGWPARLRKAAHWLRAAVWTVTHGVDQRSKRDMDAYRRHLNVLASAPRAAMSESELVSHIAALLAHDRRFGPDVAADVAVAAGFVPIFFRFLRGRLGHEGDALANRLLEGLGGLASAEAGLELWEMAAWARQRSGLAAALAEAADFASFCARLTGADDDREFLARWQRFMARHGHHACGEFDVRTPRWGEMPDYVLGMLRSYSGNRADSDPAEFRRRANQRRAACADECRRRLGNPFYALAFDYLLRKARCGVTLRENSRNDVVRMLGVARETLLELARRLAKRGVLAQCDDIFFLEFSELPQLLAGVNLSAFIATRKAEFAYNQTITPPAVIVGQFKPEEFIPEVVPLATPTLRGLPTSAGVATGPARVILNPQTGERLLPGEILVAPFTDPGWTPHFLAAAGIVMDVGGMLSHGSIVAREYGIPTVVNVGRGTHVIRTGQIVRVDGDKGLVTVLSPR